MSIYSGFATRRVEERYNKILFSLIKAVSVELSKLIITESASLKALSRRLEELRYLDQHKYLQPKFSEAFASIASHISKQLSRGQIGNSEQAYVVTFGFKDIKTSRSSAEKQHPRREQSLKLRQRRATQQPRHKSQIQSYKEQILPVLREWVHKNSGVRRIKNLQQEGRYSSTRQPARAWPDSFK